ncbi:MAG TPA: BamA/TamA family outer membrane protein [Acidiferrobacteraceae bacterium]|nr:BamA/TamA family outer membrane protein [Acidiferrobacteraceae bacterium]
MLGISPAWAADRIVAIQFVGNHTTRASVMLQQMTIHVGDPVDMRRVEASRQAIMNLGLFKSVHAKLLPAPGGQILQISVKEKYYVLPLPKVSRNANGDISYGADVSLDNFRGLNQQVELQYQRTIPQGLNSTVIKSWSFNYTVPRVIGRNYGYAISAARTRNDFTAGPAGIGQGLYGYDGRGLSFSVTDYPFGGPSQGWAASVGAAWNDNFYQYISGMPGLYVTARTVALTAGLNYTDVKDLTYSRSGFSYGYNLQVGARAFGSDYGFSQHLFYVRAYLPVGHVPHQNLDLQLELGLSSGYPQPVFFLGGSDNLRGFERNSIYGKSFVLANIQYLRPIDHDPAWRTVLFTDVGNAYPNDARINLTHLETDVGTGLRWRIRSFVNTELRLDVAYGINTRDKKIYAGTHDIF